MLGSVRRTGLMIGIVVALAGLAVACAEAHARVRVPHITSVRCWPPKGCRQAHVVAPGGTLRFTGRNLRTGMLALFPHRRTAAARAATVTARLRRTKGSFKATVPFSARSGRVRIATRSGLRSNAAGPIRIRRTVKAPPVLASKTSSLPEVVDDAGLLLYPHDPEAWSDAVLRLMENPKLRQSLSQKGLERAAQFTWERCARQTLGVLTEA